MYSYAVQLLLLHIYLFGVPLLSYVWLVLFTKRALLGTLGNHDRFLMGLFFILDLQACKVMTILSCIFINFFDNFLFIFL